MGINYRVEFVSLERMLEKQLSALTTDFQMLHFLTKLRLLDIIGKYPKLSLEC